MASTPSGKGYWLVGADGGIFAFGDAAFRGSTGAIRLNQPIVGTASTPSGKGYWLVARDGGIFAFGDAVFRGSTGAIRLNQPIVGMTAAPAGEGYWLAAADGGVFSFGAAVFHGSATRAASATVVAMAASPAVRGYWFASTNGAVYAFPSADAEPRRAVLPAPGAKFTTLPPGSALPTDQQCAAVVRRSAWEPRPGNDAANRTVTAGVRVPGFTPNQGGLDQRARALADRLTGNFTGTTDEIIQWGACKWGLDEDIVRATAVSESTWRQPHTGDHTNNAGECPPGYRAPCPLSFGLLQVKWTAHPETFPWSRDSTAFNVDYALLVRRVCFEGWTDWLYDWAKGYQAGDEWGCVGFWYSGGWMDEGARNYITGVKAHLQRKPWLEARF